MALRAGPVGLASEASLTTLIYIHVWVEGISWRGDHFGSITSLLAKLDIELVLFNHRENCLTELVSCIASEP